MAEQRRLPLLVPLVVVPENGAAPVGACASRAPARPACPHHPEGRWRCRACALDVLSARPLPVRDRSEQLWLLTWAPPPAVVQRDAKPANARRKRQDPRAFDRGFSLFAGKTLSKDERSFRPAALRILRESDRPRTRAECKDGPRPCPWVGCKHHLAIDVNRAGSLKLNFGRSELEALPETCSLDVADRGGQTIETVARVLNLRIDRIRQIEQAVLERPNVRQALRDFYEGENTDE